MLKSFFCKRFLCLLCAGIMLFTFYGCKSESDDYEDTDSNVQMMVNDFNSIADFTYEEEKLVVDNLGSGITVNFGSDLEDSLALLCSIYTAGDFTNETFDDEKVRNDLQNETKQTSENYLDSGTSFYLYKLFKWCGETSYENIVYQGDPMEENESMSLLKDLGATNFQVVRAQAKAMKEGTTYCYKFKWQ